MYIEKTSIKNSMIKIALIFIGICSAFVISGCGEISQKEHDAPIESNLPVSAAENTNEESVEDAPISNAVEGNMASCNDFSSKRKLMGDPPVDRSNKSYSWNCGYESGYDDGWKDAEYNDDSTKYPDASINAEEYISGYETGYIVGRLEAVN